MASYGEPEEFNTENVDWQHYIERLGHYILANEILDKDKWKAFFLIVYGSKTDSLLMSYPQKPGGKSTPRPNIILECFRFHNRMRRQGEKVAVYAVDQKRLMEYCSFGNVLEDMLQDRLICCIKNERISRQLMSEENFAVANLTVLGQVKEAEVKNVQDLHKE